MYLVYILSLSILTYTHYTLMESIFQICVLEMFVFMPGEHGWKTYLAWTSLKDKRVGLTLILEKF